MLKRKATLQQTILFPLPIRPSHIDRVKKKKKKKKFGLRPAAIYREQYCTTERTGRELPARERERGHKEGENGREKEKISESDKHERGNDIEKTKKFT